MFICCTYSFCLRQLCYIIMCSKLCQQLFSTFFDFVSALSKKALKTHLCFIVLLLPCSATLDNIHPGTHKSQHYFLKYFQKGILTNTHNFFLCFCAICTYPFIYLTFQQYQIGFYETNILPRLL